MFTGTLIPLQMLPEPLKIASTFFPLTFGIDLSRHHLLHTSLVFPYMFEWLMLLLELLVLAAVSLLTLKYVERTAKKQGLHFA
jgi:ABC-2 type transport system permease protein